jgi:ribonuclease VapC
MIFLDASAVVAIITREKDSAVLLSKIMASRGSISYSSLTMFEAVIAIARKDAISIHGDQRPTPPHMIEQARKDVGDLMKSIGAVEVDMSAGLHDTALDAAKKYGRFVGHPAKLNFGDCFSYATAKSLKAPLLFVGNDFAQTDIEVA